MKKVFCLGFITFFLAIIFLNTKAQHYQKDSVVSKTIPTYRVGIFAPLYLDSVFNNNTFRYQQGIPKFIVPALEFVQGAQIALDSLNLTNANLNAFIYDSKSYSHSITTLINSKSLDKLDLIIASVKDIDYKQLADFALQKNIPFISATYPNDGGVVNNPFTIIMNSTLKSHCEAIYSYLLQNHGIDAIFLCKKKGVQEDKIATYFKTMNEQDGKPLLKIITINQDSAFTSEKMQHYLDSNRNSILIGASLDEKFAINLSSTCYNLSGSYPITLIGMPNWDGFSSLKKDAFEDFPIYFTSPYFNNKWDENSKMLSKEYLSRFKIKPSDMAFKGFEAITLFVKIFANNPNDFINHVNDKNYKVFCEYNIKPVLLKKENNQPDYFENKHLYFIKILNGTLSKAW